MSREKHIPVGIYNNEIFIAKVGEDGKMAKGYMGKPYFNGVLRPVTESDLDRLRDSSEREDEYFDLWKQAVQADSTRESFDEWFDQVWGEEYDEDDEEDFPGKDGSDCQYLTEEFREEADSFLEKQGIKVGTWESSGSYSPTHETYHDGEWRSDFKKFDYVFSDPLSQALAKEYVKSIKK